VLGASVLGCSKSGILANLSIEELNSRILNESVLVGSEDVLLQFILNLEPGNRELLNHIQIEFLNEDPHFSLREHFGIPPESAWHSAPGRIAPSEDFRSGRF
jgi:hypothetical protein